MRSSERNRRSGGYVPPTREDRGSGVKKEESEGRIEEIVQKQSQEAQRFYEELWRKEEEKEQKKRDYWRNFDRKMKQTIANVAEIRVKVDSEVAELRQCLLKIYKKYREAFKRAVLKELEDNKDIKVLKRYAKGQCPPKDERKAEILLATLTKKLLKETLDNGKRKKWVTKIVEDLKKIYEISKRLAMITGREPLPLIVLEAEALRGLATSVKVIETMMFLDTGVKRIHYENGETFTKMFDLKYPVMTKKVKIEVKPEVAKAVTSEITEISKKRKRNGTVKVYGSMTSIGSKDNFDYPFRTDFIGYMDDNGRILRTELNRALSSDEKLTCFEYGDA